MFDLSRQLNQIQNDSPGLQKARTFQQIRTSIDQLSTDSELQSKSQNSDPQKTSINSYQNLLEAQLQNQNYFLNINQLSIQKKIGYGVSSQVYLGEFLHTQVAIKQIYISDNQLDQIKNTLKEIHILSQLRHPNIVQFIGVAIDQDYIYVVTEYLENNSLSKILYDQFFDFMFEQKIDFAKQITRAMIYMHNFNPQVLHRDLKTANILCDKNYTIKLCDFGNSKQLDMISNFNTLTVGSPEIMAPEYILDQQFFDKSDVYSFGVVLWEIFTCKTPYQNKFPAQIAYDISQGKRLSLDDIDKRIQNLINLCWQQNRQLRPTFIQIYQILCQI